MAATKTKPNNRIANNGKLATPAVPAALFNLDKLRIQVVGVTPLLCANPADMQPDTGEGGRSTSKKSKLPKDVARSAAYFDADGHCAFPNAALITCILTAAELMKLKVGSGRYPPSAVSIIQAGLSFDYETINTKLIHPKTGKPLTEDDYEVDMRRGVNQNTGGGIVVIRPRFDEWSATFDMLIDTSNSDLVGMLDSHFADILAYAGMSVGLGAFRAHVRPKGKGAKPRPGGPFGKFVASIV
jgi:hypothetical protein